jgi:hypothetical protein
MGTPHGFARPDSFNRFWSGPCLFHIKNYSEFIMTDLQKNKEVHLRVPVSVASEVESIALVEDRSISSVYRRLINQGLIYRHQGLINRQGESL